MPFYSGLRKFLDDNSTDWLVQEYGDKKKEKLQFIIDRMLKLKKGIRDQKIPSKTISETLLLATWNIREFDSNGKKLGPRLEESYYYIAEIINCFDLVAVQEVKQDLTALKKVVRILGPAWDFLVTDVTEGTSGNGERMAYVYDKSKVLFTNIAGEIVLPKSKSLNVEQFARTPYLVSFQSGWLKLNLCTVHIYFGNNRNKERRVKEIGQIAEFFKKRSNKDKENYILLGDFNIVGKEDETMRALLKGGFKIPPEIQKNTKGSNLDRSKFYDQIVYRDKKANIQFTQNAGVFDFYQYVFREDEAKKYKKDYNILRKFNKKKKVTTLTAKAYKEWKTFQMSDHLPLWVEFKIDFSEQYLQNLPSVLRPVKES